jgi:putative NIF3 family GTP cyclohydrolase 1 type 2
MHNTRIKSIVAALDELLEPAAFDDLGPSGLQVPPPPEKGEATHVVTGVSAQRELFERAEVGNNAILAIHFIAAGHYATETFGVRALGERIAARFGLEHTFVDIPNPV